MTPRGCPHITAEVAFGDTPPLGHRGGRGPGDLHRGRSDGFWGTVGLHRGDGSPPCGVGDLSAPHRAASPAWGCRNPRPSEAQPTQVLSRRGLGLPGHPETPSQGREGLGAAEPVLQIPGDPTAPLSRGAGGEVGARRRWELPGHVCGGETRQSRGRRAGDGLLERHRGFGDT